MDLSLFEYWDSSHYDAKKSIKIFLASRSEGKSNSIGGMGRSLILQLALILVLAIKI
jgi:hypothetical protein